MSDNIATTAAATAALCCRHATLRGRIRSWSAGDDLLTFLHNNKKFKIARWLWHTATAFSRNSFCLSMQHTHALCAHKSNTRTHRESSHRMRFKLYWMHKCVQHSIQRYTLRSRMTESSFNHAKRHCWLRTRLGVNDAAVVVLFVKYNSWRKRSSTMNIVQSSSVPWLIAIVISLYVFSLLCVVLETHSLSLSVVVFASVWNNMKKNKLIIIKSTCISI